MRKQFGPLYDVFREVKRIFDPHNLLNPGKVIADVPQPITKNLRLFQRNGAATEQSTASGAAASELPADVKPLELSLIWDGQLSAEAGACNGCGRCRTQSPDARMCPIFRFAPSEEASPRAKANLMRGVISGELDASLLTTDEMKGIADLCVNCHQCRLECPAEVDIPKLMIEAKAQYVASNGLDTADWVLTRLDSIARWSSRVAPLANWINRTRWTRWLVEKIFGIAQGRKLPRVAASSFLRQAERRRLTRPTRRTGGKVLYFVDLYANWYDVQLAEALVAVLEHNNIAVYVHPDQQPSGMNRISVGDIERARTAAAKNVRILAEAVRQGYEIVCSEPTAALCLTHEYPDLLDDDDVKLVAAHTHEACTYLWKMHEAGKLALNFRPLDLTLSYHLPCHQRALTGGSAGEKLLGLIKGVTVRRIERGCSGMAGTFGLKRVNYRASLRAGWGLIRALRDPAVQVGTTECSACKIQMEQGTTKPTIHPLKILALAYGAMPEIEELLSAKSEELTVT
jgi:Fe-S oxidoreductase